MSEAPGGVPPPTRLTAGICPGAGTAHQAPGHLYLCAPLSAQTCSGPGRFLGWKIHWLSRSLVCHLQLYSLPHHNQEKLTSLQNSSTQPGTDLIVSQVFCYLLGFLGLVFTLCLLREVTFAPEAKEHRVGPSWWLFLWTGLGPLLQVACTQPASTPVPFGDTACLLPGETCWEGRELYGGRKPQPAPLLPEQ